MLIVKLAMLYEGVFALKRWLLLQHLLRVWGGQFPPECTGQFRPEWVVSLRRNGVVTFIRISTFDKILYHLNEILREKPTLLQNRVRPGPKHIFTDADVIALSLTSDFLG